jgi:FAD/FMN-containing dehydrogenase
MVFLERKLVTTPTFDASSIEALGSDFAGELIQPGDERYDETRQIWNAMIDKRPALIARCVGVSDVIQAVNFAREQGMSPSIRGGGHNVAGHAVSDGGLMIDLSLMRSVHIDPARQTARVEGGATWADFEREASVFGLSTTGGVISTTGVAGLTLGGGIGWLVGKHGLTVDNLLAVELVTADGSLLRASADEHSDLFWALRGGGGNFGVATMFEFQLHPVAEVLAGMLVWPASDAREISEFYRAFTRNNPEEMTTYLQFARDPESGERIVALGVCWPGDITEGQQVIDEIRQFKSPLVDMVGPMPYRDWQRLFDDEFPHGARYYWKGVLLRDISDEVIDALVDQGALPELDSHMLVVEHYRGPMNRVDVDATAFPHREAHYHVVITGKWFDPADDENGIAWARRLNATIEPYSTRARFLNFNAVDATEKKDMVRASFGSNYDRLAKIKGRYDPTNLLRENNNIEPA